MSKVVPAGDRFQKWNLKYDPTRIKEITEAGKPTYAMHASATFTDLYQMELSVKQVLNSLGVSVLDVAPYLALGREFWSKQKKFHGETLAIEAEVLITKAVARGLTRSVCEAIRSQCFDVPPPSSP
ncbi:hypothetical protein FJY69_10345 [candidate division WOR-3 bacterium]|nr:hypothetical protein [candidate division WOR-3 bacterium]